MRVEDTQLVGDADIAAVQQYLTQLQSQMIARLEALDGGRFSRDAWSRDQGGGGIYSVAAGL